MTVHYNPTGFPNDITDTAAATVEIVSPAISVTRTATPFSKVSDDVTYTIEICNIGPVSVDRTSVIDTLLGDISGSFDATLALGVCSSATLTHTVGAGDPDPLVSTVTAVYAGISESAQRPRHQTPACSSLGGCHQRLCTGGGPGRRGRELHHSHHQHVIG